MASSSVMKNFIEMLTETQDGIGEINKLAMEMDKKISDILVVRKISLSDLAEDLPDQLVNLTGIFETINNSFMGIIKKQAELDIHLSKFLASGR